MQSLKKIHAWAQMQDPLCLKIFLIYSSGGPFIQWTSAIMVEGIMRNNSVKSFKFGPVVA